MKLFIATPMYGGNCKGVYTDSLLNLIVALSAKNYKISYSKIFNESLITRARNALVYEFLNSDADALLFIDADHGFHAPDVVKMIESGKDLIGAIYPMKAINWDTVKMAMDMGITENIGDYSGFFSANMLSKDQTIHLNEPMLVENVATGMMFITRKVFEEMAPLCATYAHQDKQGGVDHARTVTEFFKTDIDEKGVLLSEDYYFCKVWKDTLGHEVYAAPWVSISHAGDYSFTGNFAKTLILRDQYVTASKSAAKTETKE